MPLLLSITAAAVVHRPHPHAVLTPLLSLLSLLPLPPLPPLHPSSYDLALQEHVQAADMASHPAIIRLANLADSITKEEGPANADLHMHRQQQHQQGGAKPRNATILQVDSQGRPTSDRFALFERAWTVNPAFQEHAATVWAAAHGGIHHFALVKGVHRVYQKVRPSSSSSSSGRTPPPPDPRTLI